MSVSILLPTLNEEESLSFLLKEIKKIPESRNWDIYIIDGGSVDKTLEIATSNKAKVINIKERGKGKAIKKAFELIDSEYVIMLDSDLSYDPSFIPNFIKKLEECDVVLGSRFKGKIETGSMKFLNRIGNWIFSTIASLLYSKTSDVCTGMWGFRKKAYKKIKINATGFDLEVNLFIESVKNNFKICEIPIRYRKRGGYSKLNVFDGIPILIYLFKRRFN